MVGIAGKLPAYLPRLTKPTQPLHLFNILFDIVEKGLGGKLSIEVLMPETEFPMASETEPEYK